jgi:hypothetical protein
VAGDLWRVDGCGRREEKVEECGELGCRDDACEPAPEAPCREPPEGRCVGDVVQLCLAGRTLAIDCAAKGLRCGQGEEGAECKRPVAPADRCSGPPHCQGDVLVRCEDEQFTRTDCAALRATCGKLSASATPSCVALQTADPTAPCGVCGCAAGADAEAACDGRDEDGDGLIDEGLDCGVVPIRAFIATGASGQTNHAREDVEAEIAQANRLFAGRDDQPGLQFVLEDVVELVAPELLELDPDEFGRLASDAQLHPASEAFYVPALFTDSLVAGGETPKAGISTLPNGSCGGMQEGRGPELGLLAVAKARYATTFVHELGHFLGLCHTHDQQEAAPFVAYADPRDGRLVSCRPSCRGQGDGLCDTPFDPGPELCSYDATCRADCRVAGAPDPANLMGYYAACRSHFSDEQLQLMQHTVALRRGWQRCLGGACSCRLGGSECPAGMSCRGGQQASEASTPRCALDGPRAPGADCDSSADCGQGAQCLIEQGTSAPRCVRPCLASSGSCLCTRVADDLSVCAQDLARAR